MTIGPNLNRARGLRSGMQGRPSNFLLLLTTLLIVVVIAAVFAGAAIGLGNRPTESALITVPGDYSTIQAAIDAAKPGDIVQVQPGIYRENLNLDKAVVLTAATFDQLNPTTNSATLEGLAGAPTISIPSGLPQMPTIRGFVIQGGSVGIQAQSEFIAEFDFLRDSPVLAELQGGSGGNIHDNVFFKATGNAIQLDQVSRPLVIEDNRVLYSGGDGIEINLQESTIPPALIEVDISDNMLIGSTEDGIQFVDQSGGPADTNRRFVISRNLLANNTRAGVGLMPDGKTVEDYSAAQITEPVWVYNDTFFGNDYGISGGGNLVSFNNIITGSTARGVWRVQGPTGANAIVAYTLLYGNTLDSDQSTLGPGNILGNDPRFVALPNPGPDGAWQTLDDDFSGLVLRADSPAIDRGVTQLATQDGQPVPASPLSGFIGAAPDLGWREYGSPAFMTPTPSAIASPTAAMTGTPLTATAAATATITPAAPSPTPINPSPTAPAPTATGAPPTSQPTGTAAITSTPAAQVTIQALSPLQASKGATVTITITGSGFQNNASVSFYGAQGPAPQVMSVQIVNPTTILVLVDTQDDGPSAETWNLRIANPDGSSASLLNAFTVTP